MLLSFAYAFVYYYDSAIRGVGYSLTGFIRPQTIARHHAYSEISRDFSVGDRLQFTASRPDLDVKNRDLGTIKKIEGTAVTVRLDGGKGRTLTFDSSRMRHFDHGYAVTSHSSQGLTTNRVLVNMDTTAHPGLINTRFAYVSISRASQDARVYTNDAATLGERLSTDIGKTSAIEVVIIKPHTQAIIGPKEQSMTNTNEKSPEDRNRLTLPHTPTISTASYPSTETHRRHYAPIESALPNEASSYQWKRESGNIQSYQHRDTAGWLHVDTSGRFYDRQANPVTRDFALEHARHPHAQAVQQNNQRQTIRNDGQGFSL